MQSEPRRLSVFIRKVSSVVYSRAYSSVSVPRMRALFVRGGGGVRQGAAEELAVENG